MTIEPSEVAKTSSGFLVRERLYITRQIPEHRMQDSTVPIILYLHRRVDAHRCLELNLQPTGALTRLRRVHEVPIFRLVVPGAVRRRRAGRARRLCEAQDTAWGSAPVAVSILFLLGWSRLFAAGKACTGHALSGSHREVGGVPGRAWGSPTGGFA